jgi:hypothetical protein
MCFGDRQITFLLPYTVRIAKYTPTNFSQLLMKRESLLFCSVGIPLAAGLSASIPFYAQRVEVKAIDTATSDTPFQTEVPVAFYATREEPVRTDPARQNLVSATQTVNELTMFQTQNVKESVVTMEDILAIENKNTSGTFTENEMNTKGDLEPKRDMVVPIHIVGAAESHEEDLAKTIRVINFREDLERTLRPSSTGRGKDWLIVTENCRTGWFDILQKLNDLDYSTLERKSN